MKSGEDFRQAMGQADDGFIRVISQVLNDLRRPKKRPQRRAAAVATPKRMPILRRDA